MTLKDVALLAAHPKILTGTKRRCEHTLLDRYRYFYQYREE